MTAVFPFWVTTPFFIIVYVAPAEFPELTDDVASRMGAPKFTRPDANA